MSWIPGARSTRSDADAWLEPGRRALSISLEQIAPPAKTAVLTALSCDHRSWYASGCYRPLEAILGPLRGIERTHVRCALGYAFSGPGARGWVVSEVPVIGAW